MASKTPDRFLNFKEVAEMIGLAVKTVRNGECGTREIPRIKLGGRVLFSFNAVQRWMERKAREAEQAKLKSETAVIDLLTEKRRRQKTIEDTMKTIINGGRYK
jgi:predicted DNA-binding transcriptional regulator AlpA